jgi:hypothetical protein
MFNYLEVAENFIDIIVKDINKTKYGEDTIETTIGIEPKPEEIESWCLKNQKRIFGETNITHKHIALLFSYAYMNQEFDSDDEDKYNNGNLHMLPLDIMLKATHIKSVLNFIDNLETLENYYCNHFVALDPITWVNRILNVFYMDIPVKDEILSLTYKFELTDDDIDLIKQLKK